MKKIKTKGLLHVSVARVPSHLPGLSPPLAYLFENVHNYAMDDTESPHSAGEPLTADASVITAECSIIWPDYCCQGMFVLCECW